MAERNRIRRIDLGHITSSQEFRDKYAKLFKETSKRLLGAAATVYSGGLYNKSPRQLEEFLEVYRDERLSLIEKGESYIIYVGGELPDEYKQSVEYLKAIAEGYKTEIEARREKGC